MSKAKDMTGQRFGKLTVLERAPNHISPSGDSVVMWKCICDCQSGKENPEYVIRRGVELRRGHSWSCGCDLSEKLSKISTKDLISKRFGRLTVLEYAGTKMYGESSHALWKCICDCQKDLPEEDIQYTYTTTNSLTTGNTTSCGCYWKERAAEANHKKKTPNKYEKRDGYYIGYTSKGEAFYVDEEDYEKVKDYKWYFSKDGYVVATITCDEIILMHRLIMGLSEGDNRIVDHIRGSESTNDNRRYNLRITGRSENQMNRRMQRNNTSGVIGVYLNKRNGKWVADICAKNKKYHLGEYVRLEDAANARRKAEDILHGDFSYRNSQEKGNRALQALELAMET